MGNPPVLSGTLPQQSAHSITQNICQRCYRFSRYPSEEDANTHIDNKINRDVYEIAHANAVEVIMYEYVQGLHNQELPHDQSKALFSQELRKFIAKQTIIAEAAMDADDNEARAKRIGGNHVYKVGKQNGREQSQNAPHCYEQSALYLAQGILLACNDTSYETYNKR